MAAPGSDDKRSENARARPALSTGAQSGSLSRLRIRPKDQPASRCGPAVRLVQGKATAYDFTAEMSEAIRRLCTLPIFAHIQPERLLVSFSQCRSSTRYGMYAKVVPLRFTNGSTEKITRRYRWVWPRFMIGAVEKLYLVAFYLPRFLDADAREKLATIVHELYHVSPACDGDLRRFPGKNFAHGHSREAYDAALIPVTDEVRRRGLLDGLVLLTHNYRELVERYGAVTGAQYHGLSPQRFHRY